MFNLLKLLIINLFNMEFLNIQFSWDAFSKDIT